MDKKKIFAIVLFFIMGFFMFTFANPAEDNTKLQEEDKTNEEQHVDTPLTTLNPTTTTITNPANNQAGNNVVVYNQPTITIQPKSLKIIKGTSYDVLTGVTVTSDDPNVTIIPSITDTASLEVGTNIIIYTVTDTTNNTVIDNRTIIVLDPNADEDNDGFTNEEEQNSGTDFDDENSHPDTISPIIIAQNITIKVFDEYTEDVAVILDSHDTKTVIKDALKISGSVNTTKLGSYEITYSIEDTYGKTKEAKRIVTVVDDTLPVITLNGEETEIIRTTDTYSDKGATAIDNYDGDITDKIITKDNVESGIKGNYEVSYSVEDSSQNKTEIKRIIKIVDVTELEEQIKESEKIIEATKDKELRKDLEELLEDLKNAEKTGTDLIEDKKSEQEKIDNSTEEIKTIIEKINNLIFKVTFNDYNQTEIKIVEVKFNQSVEELPENPTRTGYDFNTWSGKYSNIMNDETVTATYKIINYNITYQLNDGKFTEEVATTYNVENKVTFTNPEKTGYTFVNWTLNSEIVTTTENIIGDITVVANYTANTNTGYKVNHYKQLLAGTYPSAASKTEDKTGTTDTLTKADPSSFVGFTLVDFEQSTIKPDGSTVVNIYYTRNSYNLIIDGTVSTYKYDEELDIKDPSITGYTFDGYKDLENNLTNIPSRMPANDIELTTSMTPITYQIAYNTNGGTLNGEYASTYNVESNTFSLPIPAKEGYDFTGWHKVINESIETASVSQIEKGSIGDITLSASWAPSNNTEYKVITRIQNTNGTYEEDQIETLNGTTGNQIDYTEYSVPTGFHINSNSLLTGKIKADGSLEILIILDRNINKVTFNINNNYYAHNEYKFGDSIVDPIYTPVAGHTFTGWVLPSLMGDEELTLNATDSLIAYSLTYRLNEGTLTGEYTTSYNVESNTFSLPIPTKEGYDFTGWHKVINESIETASVSQIEKGSIGDITLSASWAPSNNTEYKLITRTENVNGTYSVDQIETLNGTTGSLIDYTGYSVPTGFHINTVESNLTGNILADGSLEILIVLDRNINKVTFTINNNYFAENNFKYGETITAPNYVVSAGHTFITWVLPTTMGNTEITLNATDEINKYTVKFLDANNNEITSLTNANVEYGSKISRPTTSPLKTNDNTYIYEFNYWADESNKEYNFNSEVTSSLTLHPVYRSIKKTDFIDNETPFILVEIDNTWLDARLKTEKMDITTTTTTTYQKNYSYACTYKAVTKIGDKYYVGSVEINKNSVANINKNSRYTYECSNTTTTYAPLINITVRYSNTDILGTYADSTALSNYNDLPQANTNFEDDGDNWYGNNTGYHFHTTAQKYDYLTNYKYVYFEYTENNVKYILVYQKGSQSYSLVGRHKITN